MQEEASGEAEPPPPLLADKQTRKYARLSQAKQQQKQSPPLDEINSAAAPLVPHLTADSNGSEPSSQSGDTALDFPLADSTAAASDDAPTPVHASVLLLSSLGLLLCWVANNILWIYVSDYFGVPYAFYQNQSTAVIYLLICLPLVAWRWKRGMIPPEARAALPRRVTLIMGACDAVYNLLTSLASPRMSGPMQNLIFQLPVPLAMLMLKLAWPKGHERSSFSRGEYLGATVIVVGAVVSILPQLMQSPDADSDDSTPSTDDDSVPVADNNAISLLVYGRCPARAGSPGSTSLLEHSRISLQSRCVCFCLFAVIGVCFYTAGSVYKESALKEHSYIDCSYVSLIENIWALLLGFVLVPMIWLPGVGTDEPSNTWVHFKGGAQCMFNRSAGASNPSAQCENILWICCVWIVSNVGVNVLGLIVVRSGNALIYNLSSSVQLPITNLLFTSSFIMTSALATQIDPAMWAGLGIVCVGVAVYHFAGEWLEPASKRKKKQAGPPQQQLQQETDGAAEIQHPLQLQLQQDEKQRSLLHDDGENQSAGAFHVVSPSPSASPFPPPSPSSSSSLSPPSSPSTSHLQLRSIAVNSSSAAAAASLTAEQSSPG